MIEMRKRASHMMALGVVGGAALFAGCNSQSGTETAQSTPAGNEPAPSGSAPAATGTGSGGAKLKITVIPKGLTHSFWKAIERGARDAGKEMNAEIIWTGPASESDGVKQQQQIVEDQITKKVDGIVLAPINRVALVPVIDKAAAAKIPVVIADSDANTKNRISFIATDNYKGGVMAAERMIKLVGGKGEVGMVPVQANSQSTEDREKGFEDTIKKEAAGKIAVVRSNYGESDATKSMNAATDMLTAHPNMVAVFGPNESSAVGALNAVRNRKQIGKIKLVGFDTGNILVGALKSGDIDSLVVQNPYQMGYQGVKAIVDKKAGKDVKPRIDTGVVLVTKENMNTPDNQKLLQ